MYILVTYDVDTTSKEGARRLRCVTKACLDYGQRVQNSVFECVVTEAQYSLLKGRVRDIIDMSLDSVRFYILSKNENKRVEVIGVETAYKLEEASYNIMRMWCVTKKVVSSHVLIISRLNYL